MDWTLDWTRGLTHCGHYAVAITFLSIVRPFPDKKFNIYNEHHLVVPLCHIVEHTVPVIIIETKVPVELALFLQSTMASTWEFPYRSHS